MDIATNRLTETDLNEYSIRWGTIALDRQAQIRLLIGSYPSQPLLIQVMHPLIIGRTSEHNLKLDIDLLPYAALQNGVSRQHATLEIIHKTLMVRDLNSTNGTFLNGQRVCPQQRRVVRNSDELVLGHLSIGIFYVGS